MIDLLEMFVFDMKIGKFLNLILITEKQVIKLPGTPSKPGSPGTPSLPSNPGLPGNPTSPFGPLGPALPSLPSIPAGPGKPGSPLFPLGPGMPGNPAGLKKYNNFCTISVKYNTYLVVLADSILWLLYNNP
jgi:hypothetical protein